MPDPIPPAPNPTPDPKPISIQGFLNPWELAKIVLGTLATGGLSIEVIVPLMQKLALEADLWVVDPSQRETVRMVLGAAIAVLSGVLMTRRYLRKGLPVEVETVSGPNKR